MDELELKPDELLMHISEGWSGYSQAPEVEDYERFFADKLTEAQNVIHPKLPINYTHNLV